jgi:ketopantoate reductase
MAKYAIYGAGSLGTVLGAFITKNGGEVDLINRNKAHVEALNTKGAKIIGTVDMTVPVKAITPDMMEGKYDVIVLLTKQLFNKEVVTMLKDYLTDDGNLYFVIRKQQGAKSMISDLEKEYDLEILEKKKGYYIIKCSNKS